MVAYLLQQKVINFGFDGHIQKTLFGQNGWHLYLPFSIIHKQHRSRLSDFGLSPINGRFDIGTCAVGIITQYIDDKTGSPKTIRFESRFSEIAGITFCSSLDGAIDVLLGKNDATFLSVLCAGDFVS